MKVLSPGSASHDRVRKFQLYAQFGVREYWLVTPYPPLVEIYALESDHFRLAAGYEADSTLRSVMFPELALPMEDLFDFPVESTERIDTVKEGHPPYAPQHERSTP